MVDSVMSSGSANVFLTVCRRLAKSIGRLCDWLSVPKEELVIFSNVLSIF